MSKFKIQMADDEGTRFASTSTYHEHEPHGHETRTLSDGTTVFSTKLRKLRVKYLDICVNVVYSP